MDTVHRARSEATRRRRPLLGLAALALTTWPAFAQQDTPVVQWISSAELYRFCTTPNLEGSCIAYIEAIADTLGGGQRIFGGYRACMPAGINGYRLREIVVDYLETTTSDSRDIFSGALLVTIALNKKFPCAAE